MNFSSVSFQVTAEMLILELPLKILLCHLFRSIRGKNHSRRFPRHIFLTGMQIYGGSKYLYSPGAFFQSSPGKSYVNSLPRYFPQVFPKHIQVSFFQSSCMNIRIKSIAANPGNHPIF